MKHYYKGMLAVHLEDGTVTVRDVPRPARPPGFALLRLVAGGICNTDLELQRGYYGFRGTSGHEFVAEVAEADSPALVGRRVVGEINLACHDCASCRRGLARHCPHRTVLGIVNHPGAFAEFFTLPEMNLHPVPDSIPTDRAVFTEPLAAACEILDQVAIPPHTTVAVLGGRAFTTPPPAAAYDWVVEASGSAEGLRTAASMTRPRGTLILKSTVHGSVPVDTAALVVNEISVIGSRCGRFEAALPLLEANLIPVESLISARFPLSAAPGAFARAAAPGVLKVLLTRD